MNLFRGRQLKNIKLILLIFIACLNLRMSIQSIPPVINLIQDDLNLSNVQSSFLTSIPVMCGDICILVNRFKKLGFNKSLLILLVLLGLFTLFRGMFPMFINDNFNLGCRVLYSYYWTINIRIYKNFLKYWFVNRYLFFKYGIGCSYCFR